MKQLIVYCHPNPKSFNHAIMETFQGGLQGNKHEVRLRDLYELKFDPVLRPSDLASFKKGVIPDDIRAEQEHILWAQVITFISPVWWTGLPAVLKGYIDKVFSYGFAYKVEGGGIKGLLSDKKVLILNTTGTPRDIYEKSGMLKSISQTTDQGIFEFCGMKVVDHKYFCGVVSCPDAERKAMLEEVKTLAGRM